jgi:hypothetical protein
MSRPKSNRSADRHEDETNEGPKGNPAVVAAVNAKLTTDYVKMMNLTYEWLSSLIPFVIQKIDRVSYGLLSPDDLERALKIDPRVSKARRFLAVPFVGKDVPSLSSEFSHPDIKIGLSITANA